MKIEPDKVQIKNGWGAHIQGDRPRLPDHAQINFRWGRNGLHVEQAGREIATVDCCQLAILHIGYGDDLDATPEGFFCTRKERVIKWLEQQK